MRVHQLGGWLCLSSALVPLAAAAAPPTEGVVVPLVYNSAYKPEILDLLTQGVLKYGLFKDDYKKHSKLNARVKSTLRGLGLDIITLDLSLDTLLSPIKLANLGTSQAKNAHLDSHNNSILRRKARHDASTHGTKNLARRAPSSDKARRLLGLGLNLGLDLGIPGVEIGNPRPDNGKGGPIAGGDSSSFLNINLGVTAITDAGWDDTVTTRVMNSQNDNAWLAQIGFGTPAQTLTMFIDSGSADTTLYDPSCTTCQLSTHLAFNKAASSSYTATNLLFSTEYGDGTKMTGYMGRDVVQLASGLNTPSNQLLALVTAQQKGTGAHLYDGILGIGPDQLSFVEGNVTPFSNLVKGHKILRPVAGVALVKADKASGQPGGGEYRWGGINSNYINGGIVYAPVTSAYYWGIDLPGIYIDGVQMFSATDAKRAIVDTGTTLVYTSTAAATKIHAKIPGSSFNDNEGAWYVPCNVSPSRGDSNVFFGIGNTKFGVPVQDLAFKASGRNDGLCVSGIQGGSNSFTVLGDVFIKNHYVIFSYGNVQQTALQVGFANRTDVAPML